MQAVAPSLSDPYVGRTLDGQFRVDAPLGAGTMARVYRARQLGVERDVALKILKRELMGSADVLARFCREAELVARLAHPHVVIVHAIGRVPVLEPELGGEPYTALEYLEGPSLAALLASERGVLPLGRALHIVLGLCDAVGEAHARAIVHRDLKPENVLLVQRGDDPDFVKLLDFGLAKAERAAVELATRAGAVLGTPRYVSPEGAQGDQVGPPGDCYALATLLYQCLAGRTPFDDRDALRLLASHVSAAPPELRSWPAAAGVPEPVARVIMQNLAKRPDERARDARAFGRALVEAAQSAALGPDEIGLSSTLLGTKGSFRGVSRAAPPPPNQAALSAAAAPASGPRRAVTAGHGPNEPGARARRRRARSLRRAATFFACFLLGILAAVVLASSFGVFEPAPGGAR